MDKDNNGSVDIDEYINGKFGDFCAVFLGEFLVDKTRTTNIHMSGADSFSTLIKYLEKILSIRFKNVLSDLEGQRTFDKELLVMATN